MVEYIVVMYIITGGTAYEEKDCNDYCYGTASECMADRGVCGAGRCGEGMFYMDKSSFDKFRQDAEKWFK